MAVSKAKKKEIIESLDSSLKDASSIVFVHFKGLPMAETTELRKGLTKSGVGYTVAKKTLIRRALTNLGVGGDMPELGGEIAVAYAPGEDATLPAREVYAFQKKNEGKITIVGGVFDKAYKSQVEMTEIASIPSREVLYAQFVNLINSPIQQFVIGLSQIAEKKA